MIETRLSRPQNELLVSRKEAASRLGGVHVSTVIKLEQEGRLRPVRLTPRSGQVFYRVADLEQLVEKSTEAGAE